MVSQGSSDKTLKIKKSDTIYLKCFQRIWSEGKLLIICYKLSKTLTQISGKDHTHRTTKTTTTNIITTYY